MAGGCGGVFGGGGGGAMRLRDGGPVDSAHQPAPTEYISGFSKCTCDVIESFHNCSLHVLQIRCR